MTEHTFIGKLIQNPHLYEWADRGQEEKEATEDEMVRWHH